MLINNKKKNKGFTLIETLLVIGFVSLASAGIYNIYNKAQIMNVTDNEAKLLNDLKTDIVAAYEGNASYNGLTNTSLNASKITPFNMIGTTAGSIVNRFGGEVVITPIAFGAMADVGFRVDYPALRVDACPSLVMSLGKAFDIITVNGQVVKGYDTEVALAGASGVIQACGQVATGARVLFDYYSTSKQGLITATPPVSTTAGFQFEDNAINNPASTAPLVCDFDDAPPQTAAVPFPTPYFNYIPAIPNNIKSQLVSTFRNIHNHMGRCPERAEFQQWVDQISAERTANPSLSYQDIFTNMVEPMLINYGNNTYNRGARSTLYNSRCQTAANAKYGAGVVVATYVENSGNRCKIN